MAHGNKTSVILGEMRSGKSTAPVTSAEQVWDYSQLDANNNPRTLEQINAETIERIGDKEYVAESGSGMGRIVLKKGKTFAEQLTQSNTTYIIQDDFEVGDTVTNVETEISSSGIPVQIEGTNYWYSAAIAVATGQRITVVTEGCVLINGTMSEVLGTSFLNDDTATVVYIATSTQPTTDIAVSYNSVIEDYALVPANCVLKFEGGSISGGTIVGNNTTISSKEAKIFGDSLSFSGSWKNDDIYVSWFGADRSATADATAQLSKAVALGAGKNVIFEKDANYLVSSIVMVYDSTRLIGNGCILTKNAYGSVFCNEKYNNETSFNNNIVISGFNFRSYHNEVRGLCINMLGVQNLTIEDCNVDIQIPHDGTESVSCWAFILSGKDITIRNCTIVNLSGLFSDGIHLYYTENLLIDNVDIHTDDDCIGFVPELGERASWGKFNRTSQNIRVVNSNLVSTNNCIRFENRNNAPTNSAYKNVIIDNLTVTYSEANKSFLLIQDYRKPAAVKSENFIVSNITIKGTDATPSDLKDCVDIYGSDPTNIGTERNVNQINIFGIKIDGCQYQNLIRGINADNVNISAVTYSSTSGTSTLSFNKCYDLQLTKCNIGTKSQYSYFELNNCKRCKVGDNVITNVNSSPSGIAILMNNSNEDSVFSNNTFNNFSYAFYGDGATSISKGVWTKNVFYGCSNRIAANVKSAMSECILDNALITSGTSHPSASDIQKGQAFFNDTMGVPEWFNGTKWIDYLGNTSGVKKAGLITQRPATTDIVEGFMYTCTTAFQVGTTDYPAGVYSYLVGSVSDWITPAGDRVHDIDLPART